MECLLEQYLLKLSGGRKPISIPYESYSREFGLSDQKSCEDCKKNTRYFYNSCDTDKYFVSLHKSNVCVKSICLEDIFQKTGKIPELQKGGCCDLLLYSDNKVALVEMTCGRQKYVGGKRAKAYQQLRDSVCKLRKSDAISKKLDSYDERLALFSFRKKLFAVEKNYSDDTVLLQMKSFSKMSDKLALNSSTDMNNGFVFQIQEYPKVKEW